ncbi:MAG: YcjX family protein [Shewanella sp.]
MGNIKRSLSKLGKKISHKTQSFAHRASDRNIRLAVTGLSGSGKTAFITGLVNQLLNAGLTGKSNDLPLWQVTRDERLYGVKRTLQPDLTVASFDYELGMNALKQSVPQWPESTRNISELRLTLKYQPSQGILAKLTDSASLYLDIIDYPGEWLLDLPMLKQNYGHWSMSQALRKPILAKSQYYPDFVVALDSLNLDSCADEAELKHIAELYRKVLVDCVHQHGFYYAQPGRLLLPGEFYGSPVLAFFPLINTSEDVRERLENTSPNSTYQVLRTRYKEYQDKVITPFYKNYFSTFDRQLLLVDCFTPLNRGKEQFDDMTQALNGIMESFKFGQSNLLKRLFSPRIDKLLFAASKIDHITRDQQGNVLSLLTQLIKQSQKQAKFEGCDIEIMAISAIKATQHGMIKTGKGEVEVVKGVSLTERKPITLFPGEVPKSLPGSNFWQSQGFEFTNFAPPNYDPQSDGADFEHVRLDHLLQFLLGDKLK